MLGDALPLLPPVEPILARLAREVPEGDAYFYEPKWDGFRCLAFKTGQAVDLRSRNQSLFARYFPELVDAFRELPGRSLVVDGEIVVYGPGGFDFGALLNRIHPAGSRVERLSRECPATYVAFDLLVLEGRDLRALPFRERRRRLELVLDGAAGRLQLTPITCDAGVARDWLNRFTGGGIDGVVAKHASLSYQPGRRAMIKVKRERTADCVVGGFRVLADGRLASLLLGLYQGTQLRHVGVASSFTGEHRAELLKTLAPLAASLAAHPWRSGFGIEGRPMGRLRGAAGVWTPDLPQDWYPVRPELVAEVAYDQLDGDRFRHPARFRRWRPDRDPASCTFDQLDPAPVLSGLLTRGR